MKLYKISQNQNQGYDTYDSAIVACEEECEAKFIHPGGYKHWCRSTWCQTELDVKVEYVGIAAEGTKKGVILASFNAG